MHEVDCFFSPDPANWVLLKSLSGELSPQATWMIYEKIVQRYVAAYWEAFEARQASILADFRKDAWIPLQIIYYKSDSICKDSWGGVATKTGLCLTEFCIQTYNFSNHWYPKYFVRNSQPSFLEDDENLKGFRCFVKGYNCAFPYKVSKIEMDGFDVVMRKVLYTQYPNFIRWGEKRLLSLDKDTCHKLINYLLDIAVDLTERGK